VVLFLLTVTSILFIPEIIRRSHEGNLYFHHKTSWTELQSHCISHVVQFAREVKCQQILKISVCSKKKSLNTYGPFIVGEDGKWIQLAHNFARWCVWVITLLNLQMLLP